MTGLLQKSVELLLLSCLGSIMCFSFACVLHGNTSLKQTLRLNASLHTIATKGVRKPTRNVSEPRNSLQTAPIPAAQLIFNSAGWCHTIPALKTACHRQVCIFSCTVSKGVSGVNRAMFVLPKKHPPVSLSLSFSLSLSLSLSHTHTHTHTHTHECTRAHTKRFTSTYTVTKNYGTLCANKAFIIASLLLDSSFAHTFPK